MWPFIEFVIIAMCYAVMITFAIVVTIGLLAGMFALAYEWFSDIWWNIRETWRRYWK